MEQQVIRWNSSAPNLAAQAGVTDMSGAAFPPDQPYHSKRQADIADAGVMQSMQQANAHSVSPGSYNSLFGSRLNLASTIIQECDESGDAVSALGQQFSRVVSTDDHVRQPPGLPHVASNGRLSERRSSVDEHDVFGHLGGLELGGAASTGAPAANMAGQAQIHLSTQFSGSSAGQSGKPPSGFNNSAAPSMPVNGLTHAASASGPAQGAFGGHVTPPPLLSPGDMLVGDHWSRTLFVGNVDGTMLETQLQAEFERFGEIQTLFTPFQTRGFVVVQYYDLRAAALAFMTFLNNPLLQGRTIEVRFATEADNGATALEASVMVLLNDPGITLLELQQLFGQYGEVKEVKDVPDKPSHKIVEYFDVRHAAAALKSLNSVDIAKKLLVAQLPTPSQQAQQEAWTAAAAAYEAHSTQQMPRVLSEQMLSAAASNTNLGAAGTGTLGPAVDPLTSTLSTEASMTQAASINNLLQQQAGAAGFGLTDNSQLLAQAALLQQQGSAANALANASANDLAGQLLQQQGGMYSAAGAGYLAGSTPNLAASMLNGNAAAAANPLLSGSNASLAAAAAAAAAATDPRLLSEALQASGMLRRPGSMSTGDLTMLANTAAGAGLRGPLLNAALQHGALGGLGSAAWTASMPDLQLAAQQAGLAPWQLQEAAAQLRNQQALLGLQQSASVDNLLALQGLPPAALLLAMNNAQLQLANQLRGVRHPMRAKDRREEGALGGPGGRLSRRNLDPVAEAERKSQQEKLYALDLDKIRAGGDKRTTLMIKNIPNKYTQKMLLGTIDEEFKGTYDFFYLPIDFKNKCNVGYAFINLIRPEYIIRLVERFNHKKWEKFNSEKVCNISYARIQGKMALVAHFQNSSLLHEDKRCRPILFVTDGPMAGEQEPFPMKPVGRGMGRSNSRGSMTSLSGLAGLQNGQPNKGDLW